MTKRDWAEKIRFFFEDGTGEQLADVLIKHPVEDVELIERAFDEMCKCVWFFMDIYTHYWHKEKQEYISSFRVKDLNKLDQNKWVVYHIHDRVQFYPDSEPDHPYYSHMLKMYKEHRRIGQMVDLNEEERQRVNTYGVGYRYIFAKLLDGYTYKN
jgi:hypothetical protein